MTHYNAIDTYTWVDRNTVCGVLLPNSFQIINGDTETATTAQERERTGKNGYKNDLHVGKTVDNLLFETRQTTYASENRSNERKKKLQRGR